VQIAVGHHPTYSNGHHGNNTELVQHLEPLFEKYNVQVRRMQYIPVHHTEQYLWKPQAWACY
jgi:hypothetical protein